MARGVIWKFVRRGEIDPLNVNSLGHFSLVKNEKLWKPLSLRKFFQKSFLDALLLFFRHFIMSVTLLQKQNEEFMVAHRASSNGLNYTHFIKENPLAKVNHTSSRILYRTVGQINEKYRLKHRATRSSICSFARTAHSFTCSTLLASLARTAALICLLAGSLGSLPLSWESKYLDGYFFWGFFLDLDHSVSL